MTKKGTRRKPTQSELRLAWIVEGNKSFRWLSIIVGVVVATAFISNAAVKIATHENPSWITIVLAVLGGIGLGAVPTVRWIFKFRVYMKKDHQRLVEFELKHDSSRESTGLRKDGTSPHDV